MFSPPSEKNSHSEQDKTCSVLGYNYNIADIGGHFAPLPPGLNRVNILSFKMRPIGDLLGVGRIIIIHNFSHPITTFRNQA